MAAAIETGFVQNEIQKAAYKFEMELEANERIVVGVNKYKVDEPEYKDLLKINMKIQDDQIAFLKKVKSERSREQVEKSLSELKNAAAGSENLIPYIVESVKCYASIGEICNTMREVFGEYKERVVI